MINWLAILALYLPFQLALNPAEGIDLASIRIFILALFLFWLAKGLKDKKIEFKNNVATAFIIIFLFLNFLSLFWARNENFATRKLLFLFSIFPLYFVASQAINSYKNVLKIIKALTWSGTLAALVGIFQFFGQFIIGLNQMYNFWAKWVIWPFLGQSFSEAVLKNPSWLVNISGVNYLRATSTFPDPHMLSFFLGLLMPWPLFLYLRERRIFYLASFLLILLADLLTFSRGGYLGIFLAAIFLVIFFWNRIGKKYKLAGAIVLIVLAISLVIPSPISQRFFSSFDLKEGSNVGRMETWHEALKVVETHPVLGVGLGNYPIYIKPTADYREPIYAHNTYLDIWAESGIISILAFAGLLIAVFSQFWKKSRENMLYVSGMVGIIIFATHSLVETAIYSPVVLTLFILLISLTYADKNI